jgi:hypothetical protein
MLRKYNIATGQSPVTLLIVSLGSCGLRADQEVKLWYVDTFLVPMGFIDT